MKSRHFVALVAGMVLAMLAAAAPVQAQSVQMLQKPAGPVVLTVAGAISHRNAGDVAVFDMAMLDGLKSRVARVKTPWADSETTYEGALGSAVLEAVGAQGKTLLIKALNDYVAEVPAEDFLSRPVILATKRDGRRMSVRDKGPIFVIYPFDLDPSLQTEMIYNRSVWQVKEITVK